ncbi:hypothetical protein DFH27DRAFT_641263 [Peziza echinospora]|nr:hypothetical protein DFH27DRAFT_641263 [Peziza echinospora]
MGLPSPARFVGLYNSLVEPHFSFAVESYFPSAPASTTREIDSLQIRFARCALGLPASTNRLLVMADLGLIPTSVKLLALTLRFVVYILRSVLGKREGPDDRPVFHALMDSYLMWKTTKKGWYADLTKKVERTAAGLMAALHALLESTCASASTATPMSPEVQNLPGSFVRRYRTKATEELRSFVRNSTKMEFLASAREDVSLELTAYPKPYTLLPCHLSFPMAKFRFATHSLKIHSGRFSRMERKERRCRFGCNSVEDEMHVLMFCQNFDPEREAWLEEMEGLGIRGEVVMETMAYQRDQGVARSVGGYMGLIMRLVEYSAEM